MHDNKLVTIIHRIFCFLSISIILLLMAILIASLINFLFILFSVIFNINLVSYNLYLFLSLLLFILGVILLITSIARKSQKKLFFNFLIILISLVIFLFAISLQGNRGHSDRSRVFMDVNRIKTALDLYYMDLGHYPAIKYLEINNNNPVCIASRDRDGNKHKTGFVHIKDSENYACYSTPIKGRQGAKKGKNCPEYISYIYRVAEDLKSYYLEFCIEEKLGNLKPGIHIMTKAGIEKKP